MMIVWNKNYNRELDSEIGTSFNEDPFNGFSSLLNKMEMTVATIEDPMMAWEGLVDNRRSNQALLEEINR
jgi:hypothetical protein